MLKSTVIAILIAASSATSVLPSNVLTVKSAVLPATATSAAAVQNHVYYESAHCRTAQRQIATYSRALSRLDAAATDNQLKIVLYRQFRQTEQDWLDKNCRPVTQTAENSFRNNLL